MSDDEVDLELLELLRQSMGMSRTHQDEITGDTGVLADAQYIYNNATDVSIDMYGTKAAAASIYKAMQERGFSADAWSQHELHPTTDAGFSALDLVNFVFTMDLLNFSFWSDLDEPERFQVEYRGQRWTGYNSLVACLRRALDDEIPITTPRFWRSAQASEETLKYVFRSATVEQMPLLDERIAILREAAEVLHESFEDSEDSEDEVMREQDLSATTVAATRSEPMATLTSPDEGGVASGKDATARSDETTIQVSAVEESATEAGTEANQLLTDTIPDGQKSPPSGVLTKEQPAEGSLATATLEEETPVMTMPAMETPASEASVTETPAEQTTEDKSQPVADMGCETATAEDHASERSAQFEAVRGPTVQQNIPRRPDYTVVRLVQNADRSAGKLINLLAKHFAAFRDEARFDGKKVRLLKRAQIFVADLWAALHGTGYGEFYDIDVLTMFADYRVPQMLHSLGVLSYCPPLTHRINARQLIDNGHSWEVQLRGCSIWAVELIRREMVHRDAEAQVNAVLIDFFLYDLAKEREKTLSGLPTPHHRTRSVWY